MKKAVAVILLCVTFIFCSCAKNENRADTSLKDGETSISGIVEKVEGNSLLIRDSEGSKYYFTYSDDVQVVQDGWYVVDMSADSFQGMDVTVICSQAISETFPMQLNNERMIILEVSD